jgi:hypothetical protein
MIAERKSIHVVPMGLELDRVLGGLKEFPTNRAIFLYGREDGAGIEARARRNGERVRKMVSATIDVSELSVNVFDFQECTEVLRELFSRHASSGYDVYVNISTGNRIVTSAALLAAFMTGARPYYVRPKSYSIPDDQEVLSHGVSEVMVIPRVAVKGPTAAERSVLVALRQEGGSVRHETSLIPLLEGNQGFFDERREDESKRSYLARKRAQISRLLRNMEREGYVSLLKRGRYVHVSITDSGRLFSGNPSK